MNEIEAAKTMLATPDISVTQIAHRGLAPLADWRAEKAGYSAV
jgi:hypothetical protein